MSLFKRAAVRGVAHELMRRGYAPFPSKEAADEAADAVADMSPSVPEMTPECGHAPEDVASVSNRLIEIAHELMATAGQNGAAPEASKAAMELQKFAAYADFETVAAEAAAACMDKAAMEVKLGGSLIEGGDKGNTPEQAAATSEVAALDQKQRPQGAYQVAAGDTAFDTNKGELGSSEKHPASPSESPAGSNSLVADSQKKAALQAHIRKLAASLIHGGDKGNTPEQAAKVTEIGALDQKQRPEGSYKVEPGGANFSEPQSARVGKEMPHPEMPGRTVSGTNSVIAASKSAEEAAYLTLFRKCAEDVGPYLPPQLSEDEKIASISHMIGFDHEGRQAYLNGLYEKVASAAPAATPLLESIRSIAAAHTK